MPDALPRACGRATVDGMRVPLVLALALLPSCEEPPAPPPPAMQRLVPPPPAPPAPAPAVDLSKVKLAWAQPAAPLAYVFTVKNNDTRSFVEIDARAMQIGRETLRLAVPAASSTTFAVSAGLGDDLRLDLLPETGGAMQTGRDARIHMYDSPARRVSLTPAGFVSVSLSAQVRDALAAVLELSPRPVAVGDTWPISTTMMGLGFPGRWVGEKDERVNRATLQRLTPQPDGDTLAVVVLELGQDKKGVLGPRTDEVWARPGSHAPVPFSTQMHAEGTLAFLVKAGRVQHSTFHEVVEMQGCLQGHLDRTFELTPLDKLTPALAKQVAGPSPEKD
jgi:hypothetical protein